MKNLKLLSVLFSLFTITALFQACEEEETDPCADVTCLNGGTCNDGSCDCALGYEGDDCSTETRDAFEGAWTYTTTCAFGETFNSSTVNEVAGNVLEVTLTNLTSFNDSTTVATISGNTLSIASQQVVDENGNTWAISSDTATLTDGMFTIAVVYELNGLVFNCQLNYVRP